MPSLDALLDSLGLHNRLQALDTTSGGELVISVMLSDQPTGHVVDVLIPSPVQDTVLRMVLGSLRAAQKNAPSAFRVREHHGRTTGIVAERSILCLPEAVGGRMGQAPVVGRVTVQGGNAPRATTVRQFTSRLRIGTNGRVNDVDLGGGSGFPEIDRSVRASMESQYFRPATLDGNPVEVWFSSGKAELVR